MNHRRTKSQNQEEKQISESGRVALVHIKEKARVLWAGAGKFLAFLRKPTKRQFKQALSSMYQKKIALKTACVVGVLLIVAAMVPDLFFSYQLRPANYELNNKAQEIVGGIVGVYANKLQADTKNEVYQYNEDYQPGSEKTADGLISGPRFSASFKYGGDRTYTIHDVVNNVNASFTPKFSTAAPKDNGNRLIYPLRSLDAQQVLSLKASYVKEDIIVNSFQKDQLSFKYKLSLDEGTEARLENDGSIGIYGVNSSLLGDVNTSTEQDKQLLSDARNNGAKTNLLFRIPKPVVVEPGKKQSAANAYYVLEGDDLTINASNLRDANYPLSIDPTIYIDTAEQLMQGNNETNIDFDVGNELIQKSQTTGARIDAWQGNLDMSEGIWDGGSAAAGGYVYRAGGRTGTAKPQIVDQTVTTDSNNSTTFTMNMPSSRPAGDLYIAVMCHDNAGATVSAPAGWTEYADIGEHAAYYKVGTDQGGGNEASSYNWGISASEAKAGVIIRVTGFNASDPVSGTPGTGSSGSNSIPDFPATTPDNGATLVIRAVGADNDVPSATGWVPSGHTKIASDTSGGQDCGFVSAALDNPPASGVSTGTATLNDNSLNDTWGASSIAINPSGTTPPPQIQAQQSSQQSSDSHTFTMSMPSSRPAGDLYVAVMCHDGTGAVTAPSGGGWTEYADTSEHAAYYKIGTDQGGGNEASSYTWSMTTGGSNEIWAGVIVRVSGFDSSDPVSGTPGTGSSGSNSTPVFPATTPDNNSTLVIRSAGADNDTPSATGWVPAAHSKIDSGTPNVANDCGYVAATMDFPPASGISTGTATLGDTSINDTWGASTIAINPAPSGGGSESVRTTLNWAKFNSSTLAIESPNPGNGACSGWCNDPTYDLPSGRRGFSMVAYNGYLYVMGGVDSGGSRASTIYVAKLGANGEPQLWHPTDTDKNNWDYWYTGTGATLNGSTAKSYFGAVAYNNRMYILGGETNASPGGITTVEMADILPNGTLGTWTTTGMQALPGGAGDHMLSVQVYNDTLYAIGGFEGASTSSSNLRNTVYYSKLNSDGTMNSWQATSSFSTARSTYGGTFSVIWGAYIYMGGGCSAVNASGYCTTISGDMQLASINADGSLDIWTSLGSLDNTRIGYSLIAWQGGLYRLGGCTSQDSTSGICTSALADVDYGVINPAGEVSTVNISEPSGTSPCSGGSPTNCDLPPTGDSAGQGGQMLNESVILNGYLYVIGGCTNFGCTQSSGNISYVSIGSDGSMQAPSSCGGTSYGAWCVDSTNRVNGTSGISAAGVTTFNNRIYLVGGIDETANGTGNIYYNTTNTDGSLSGAWSSTSLSTAGVTGELAYTYVFSRANPASAGSNPGNLYVLGGCGDISASAGCGSSNYRQEVYKCNITTTGSVSGCSTSGQLQIDSTPGYGNSTDGLGIHSGTVYAGYIFLVGGYSQFESDKDDVLYAKIDNSNNIVAVSGSDWIESSSKLSVGRRRGWAFGYNGHIYAVGGYDDSGTGIIPFIEWSKMNVSDGSIDSFVTSSVTINQRWGLSMAVSNSYAYVIGGCDVGSSPSGCSSFEPSIQTFQLYNNDSGSVKDFTAQSDQTFSTDTDRWGASSAVYNGYLYVAGGCTSATDCTTATTSVQYAPLSASDGSVGTWAAGGSLPLARAWGSLEVAGGTLYYIGGQDSTATNEQSTVYYTSSISSGNPTWNGTAATNGLPGARTKFGSSVWNDRIYVVGGLDGGAAVTNTVYVSPQLSSGGNITSAWSSSTTFNVARTGAAVTAYANNLYLFGGYDGSNYLSDVQFTQINSDGTVDSWSFTKSLAGPLRDARAVSANGYFYLVGGRSAASTCNPKVVIAPISANTTIASGNNPTGVGEWYETNVRYTGDRYGAAVAYANGKIYTMGGGCTAPLSSNRHYYSTVNSQPQVAAYSRLIDTDTDVFPNAWLVNGLDNSIGARWQARYRSMNDTDGVATDCGTADMTSWGQETNYGEVTLGDVMPYTPKDGSGNNINCARYYYFFIKIDASKTFGYPEDVTRGPTITDLSLFFTADPSKRLRHGKTFTGGVLQPLDTPCRQSVDSDCPLP